MKELDRVLFNLKVEKNQLSNKIKSLEKFRGTDDWNKLSVNHKQLLDIQLQAMRTYLETLVGRCLDIQERIDNENTSEENKPKNNEEPIVKIIILED